jgi:hypothetical protein
VPDGLDWPVWRLVVKRVATLAEIETHWSLRDLILANEALDLDEEIERRAEKARTQQQGG